MTNGQNSQGQVKDKFWDFVQQTEESPAELTLYGPISSTQSWWEDRVTPKTFNDELKAIGDVDEIVVRINSGGGDVFAANAIYARLKDHKAKITVKIDGWAASAATIIAMAADVLQISGNGVFMIHDPKLYAWDYYTAEQLVKMANELKVIKQSIINGYVLKTNKDEQEISNLMSEETWYTGIEAVESGFCDELMFEAEVETEVENAGKVIVNKVEMDVSIFENVPTNLLNSPKSQGRGMFINKGQKPKQKESENNMSQQVIASAEELERVYPDLVKNIREQAVTNERSRIKAIDEMGLEGFEDIVENAKYQEPVAAEQVAMKIIAKQKEMGTTYLNNREDDVENGNLGSVGVGGQGERGAGAANDFDTAIDKLFPATK